MVGRLKREKDAVRRDLEEAGKENNRLAEELLEVSQESRALSKWGLENMRGKKQITKELIEVRAGNKTQITALQDALLKKESHLGIVKGEVLGLLEQMKAQEERCQGDLKEVARETGGKRGSRASRPRKGKRAMPVGAGSCRESFGPPPVVRRTYRGWLTQAAA